MVIHLHMRIKGTMIFVYTINCSIDHLQVSLNEFIKMLIVVMSWLDVVIARISMVWHIQIMLWFKYILNVNFANNNRKMLCIVMFVGSKLHLLATSHSEKSISVYGENSWTLKPIGY